jgi:hypothetical protein
MPLERRVDRFARESPELALASARANLNMILANTRHLLKVRKGEEKLKAAQDFDAILKRGDDLTPNQMSYIEGILEAVWDGAGYPSANVHHDKPRFSMRNPK